MALLATACGSSAEGNGAGNGDGALGEAEAAVAAAPPLTTSTAPPPEPLRILVVGDSYSSGEGLADAEGRCSRSPSAYGPLAAGLLSVGREVERFVLAACTGARTPDWPAQASSWSEGSPNLIATTFGGNDAGFVEVLLDCIGLDDVGDVGDVGDDDGRGLEAAADFLFNRGCDLTEDEAMARVEELGAVLRPLYQDMAGLVGADGQVFVLGYPAPVAEPDEWPTRRCDGISRSDGRFIRGLAAELNRTIEAATDVADNVHFVEVASAFDGHERCGADPWLYGIDDILGGAGDGDEPGLPPSLARPFHPTGEGHRTLAVLLTQAVRAEA